MGGGSASATGRSSRRTHGRSPTGCAVRVHLRRDDALLLRDALLHGGSSRTNPGERGVIIYRYGGYAYLLECLASLSDTRSARAGCPRRWAPPDSAVPAGRARPRTPAGRHLGYRHRPSAGCRLPRTTGCEQRNFSDQAQVFLCEALKLGGPSHVRADVAGRILPAQKVGAAPASGLRRRLTGIRWPPTVAAPAFPGRARRLQGVCSWVRADPARASRCSPARQ